MGKENIMANQELGNFIDSKKRIILKIGTQVLLNNKGKLSPASFKIIVEFANSLINKEKDVILVSSGAIAAGKNLLNIETPSILLTVQQKQALAACGQTVLMKNYASCFKKYGIKTAQILLTKEDIASRKRFINARNTIYELLKNKVVPIINENDTTSTEEIKFSDNDHLSSLAANLACADLLIILSNVDGVYDKNPDIYKDARKINIIENIKILTKTFKEATKSRYGTGGMKSKLQAAYIASEAGIDTIITTGKEQANLKSLSEGKLTGTLILSSRGDINKKKHWLLFGMEKKGTIICDKGAEEAILHKNRSLLASGIISTIGNFKKNDGVFIENENKDIISIGIANFSSEDIKKIQGLKSEDIKTIFKNKNLSALVIHKDNMVSV